MALRASGTTAKEAYASRKKQIGRGLIPNNRLAVSGTIRDQARVRADSREAQAALAVVPEARKRHPGSSPAGATSRETLVF